MRVALRQAALLAWKDTRVFVGDRFAVAFAFLFPLVLVVALAVAFGDVDGDEQRPPPTLTTAEPLGGLSHQLIAELGRNAALPASSQTTAEARAELEAGELSGYIEFPATFSQRLIGGQPTEIRVVRRSTDDEEAAALSSLAGSMARTLSIAVAASNAAAQLAGDAAVRGAPPQELFAAAGAIEIEVASIGEAPSRSASNFALSGYLTMFVFFAAALSAESITRERKNQTIERMLANGVGRAAVVLGKYLGGVYKGLAQLAVLWGGGIGVLGVNVGASPLGVVVISLLFVLLSSGFGVMLAAVAHSVNAAGTAGVLSSLVLAPIGGSWWPTFITPPFMQQLARLSPHGWANGALNKLMLFGADFGDVVLEVVALAIFAVGFVAVGVWRFRLTVDG